MRCDLFLIPGEVSDYDTKGRRVAVVDVLRACTSIAVALDAGVERVIPAESVEEAKALVEALDREYTLLAGEKDGVMVPGFDLGNSPGEFRQRKEEVGGKSLVFTSSNGASLMTRLASPQEQVLLSFATMTAVARYVRSKEESELTIVCAGQGGRFSLEDAVCGGMLCHLLLKDDARTELNDGAYAARLLYDKHKRDLAGLLRRSDHGRFLAANGMEADLVEAARIDSVSLVPVVREGRITAVRAPAAI